MLTSPPHTDIIKMELIQLSIIHSYSLIDVYITLMIFFPFFSLLNNANLVEFTPKFNWLNWKQCLRHVRLTRQIKPRLYQYIGFLLFVLRWYIGYNYEDIEKETEGTLSFALIPTHLQDYIIYTVFIFIYFMLPPSPLHCLTAT